MKKILFIDDETDILESLEIILSHYNFNVTTSSNSLEGLEIALNEDFDLVITDYNMPNLTGIELIKKLKLKKPNIPVILLSGYLDDEVVKEAGEVGVLSIMDKPFDISKIISLLGYL